MIVVPFFSRKAISLRDLGFFLCPKKVCPGTQEKENLTI